LISLNKVHGSEVHGSKVKKEGFIAHRSLFALHLPVSLHNIPYQTLLKHDGFLKKQKIAICEMCQALSI